MQKEFPESPHPFSLTAALKQFTESSVEPPKLKSKTWPLWLLNLCLTRSAAL